MATARHGDTTYTVELAESRAERDAVYALRESEYQDAQSYLISDVPAPDVSHRAADIYDERSFIFACTRAGDHAPVATCRFTVPLRGRFELDDLVEHWTRPNVPKGALVETSRVVVRRDFRATGLVEAMLLLAGTWLLRETPLRFNFAVCARPLERLYARLGMKLTSEEELTLQGRPAHRRYVVIYGDMRSSQPGVARRLKSQGWDLSEMATSQAGRATQRKAAT